uniref:N/A n=1 Tax=Ganoderma boninense TaxID=34458 RepID=A0A5K1K1F5_9APHY|nr:N/A [Ganoderma boninense]
MIPVLLVTLAASLPLASAHIALWHPSMYGFNVTDSTFPYDNRPVAPLQDYTFSQWWFHGHLDYPPNPGDIFSLPAGQPAVAELGCNKGVTSYWASSEGHTDVSQGDNPCPSDDGSFPSGAMHTTGLSDVKGCALAIAYESDVSKVQPADFAVFSVNHTCVWTRNTTFDIPARMPPCPAGGCHCAWFWIHAADAGGEQSECDPDLPVFCLLGRRRVDEVILDYMNGFRCNITGSTSDVPLAKAQVPRRCGADPTNGKPDAVPGNCTYGAKQPFYWFQLEENNMFEGTYSPPEYTDVYNFEDGAQDDIFEDSYPNGIPRYKCYLHCGLIVYDHFIVYDPCIFLRRPLVLFCYIFVHVCDLSHFISHFGIVIDNPDIFVYNPLFLSVPLVFIPAAGTPLQLPLGSAWSAWR